MDWDGFGAQARSFLHRARSTHRDCCASLSSPRPNALIGVSSSSTIPGQQCPLREVCNKRARAGPTTQLPYKGSTSSEQRCDRGAQAWMVERLEFSGGDCLVVRREASRLARVSASARRALRIWRTREIAAIASPPQILSTSSTQHVPSRHCAEVPILTFILQSVSPTLLCYNNSIRQYPQPPHPWLPGSWSKPLDLELVASPE